MDRINKDDDQNLNIEEFKELFNIFSEDIPEIEVQYIFDRID